MLTHNEPPHLHQWVREAKKLFARNNDANTIGQNIQISTKQPKKLQKIVRESNFQEGGFEPPSNPGCFKCGKCKVACPIIKESKLFTSTNTKKNYKIKKYLDCNSEYVVYLGTCKKCGGQYCGKSKNKFKVRHSGHKQEITKIMGV